MHHAADGSFRNPWPDSEPHGLVDVLRWARARRGSALPPTPPRGFFPVTTPGFAQPRLDDADASATWVGHSTIIIQMGGRNILTDPMWSERAFPVQWAGPRRVMPPAVALEALPPLDIVLLSHSHYDHLDKSTVKWIARRHHDAIWVTPLGLGGYLRGFGVKRIMELDWWESADVHGIRIAATPARHFSARRVGDRNRTLWSGFTLEGSGRRCYFAGDSAYHREFSEIGARYGPFDLVAMPIGAYDPRWFMQRVHVNPEEAVQACVDLGSTHRGARPALTLGIHWGTFRLTDEPMDEPPRRTRVAWTAAGLSDDRLWIPAFGETRAW
ncbi:MAG: MBL fold metallo-hydrolase [Gemmatimonadaceae bacterium]|nr:MBL fold metallo-hydrolase [Gemmatimonadaceae bacterium]